MARIFIYSTLTCDNTYTTWSKAEKGSIPTAVREIVVKGGANVATKQLVTNRGVMTEITEDDYQHLIGNGNMDDLESGNEVFKRHVKNGFLTIRHEKVDPEVAVADGMTQSDLSAPITPNDPRLNQEDGVKPMDEKTTAKPSLKDRLFGG